jgi:Enoyl-CoA hydratase/isomerase
MSEAAQKHDQANLLLELRAAGAIGVAMIDLSEPVTLPSAQPGVVRIGIHRNAVTPGIALDQFDILLSATEASAPWVWVAPRAMDDVVSDLLQAVERQPFAAAIAAQVVGMSPRLDFEQGLLLESLGYSTLLASAAFRTWRSGHPATRRDEPEGERVALERRDDGLHIRLTRPWARNAVDARMRDALAEALAFAIEDPDEDPVTLSGDGPSFCAGGDLNEFGRAGDPGRAHVVRTLRSATGALHRIRHRATARVHGACVGAGIEIAAAAGRVIAASGAVFRLPEVGMGLIPGAGGTVSIPRRIGRQRACYMALSGAAVDATTALDWGLIDAIETPA